MQAQSSDDSGSDPNGPSPKPSTSKRTSSSSGSKMWNRMSWFKRRSRSKENVGESSGSSAVVSPRGSGHSEDQGCSFDGAELDFSSPSTSTSSCSPLQLHSFSLGSSSSSESDLYDGRALGRDHQLVRDHPARQARPYPNSEVIEQSCLRPSVARALFLQLEAWMVKKDDRVAKYAWPKKKRACQVQEDPAVEDLALMMTRTQSMPGGMVTRSKCHCVACCSCSPKERLEGACPVYKTLNQSTTSLDTGLATLGFSPAYNPLTDCADTNAEISPSKSQPTHCNGTTDSPKCNSLPANSRLCPVCNKYLLPASSPLPRTTTTASCDNQASTSTTPTPPTLPDVLETCQCDQDAMPAFRDTRCRAHRLNLTELYTTELPKNTQQRVAPTEFKERTDTIKQWFSEFNDEQKNLILKQLLTGCDLPQLHLLSLEMESRLHASCPPNCQDRLSWLPQTVSFHIMGYLDPVSLCHASSVCKSWADVANEPSLWRRFCGQTKWRLSVGGEHKQLLQHMRPDGAIEWKKVFAERYRLRNNWIRGKCNVRTFTGHHQGISCVQFDDTRIVSGSSDKTIKVWNIRTNNPWAVQTLVGHSGTVRCLHLDGNRLVSGSTDSTIKVWDLSTQQSWSSIACKVTMVGHTDTVRCLQVDQEKVISGSYDKTLKVWDIKTGVCQRSLRGHSAAVLCVQFDDSKIVSGSCDKTIKVWNVEGDCMMTLEGHHDAVTCLQFDKSRIFSGSLDCNLKFWDIHSGQCVNTIDWKASEGHTGVVRCLQADSWRVVSASDDRTLKVWSLETGQRLVTLRNHSDGVTCLQFNDSIIVSGSYDKTVKLWDFSCC